MAYVYSSAARAGPKYEDELKLSGQAKASIEQHCQFLGDRGLPWTYVISIAKLLLTRSDEYKSQHLTPWIFYGES